MKVLYVTSEAHPFASSGGLGDVAGSLPQAMRKRLVGTRIVMPMYESIDPKYKESMRFITSISVPVSWRRQYCGVYEAKHNNVIYYLLDNQYYFKRAELYGHFDDAERFAFLSRAALEILPHIEFTPDVIEANDWQCALVPVYYSLFYANREGYQNIKTVYTIHNIQYQGQYGKEILGDVFGLPPEANDMMELDNCVNLAKGAIEAAHMVTTVSPTYAQELMDPWYAHGLDGILRARSWKLHGILNGIDYDEFNPETGKNIFENYNIDTVAKGKAANKKALQEQLGLPVKKDVPLISMVTRLVSQKGLDLVTAVLEEILQADLQMVVLGSGDWQYEQALKAMAAQYPQKLSVTTGFLPELSKKIYAASDIFLMPSKSEPCGLAQMIALRYGTIPIVRETGGLKDSISDMGDGEGNGITFKNYDPYDMLSAIWRAVGAYQDGKDWPELVKRAMACDNSWGKSANAYIRLFKELLK